jgi:hypothetical protein
MRDLSGQAAELAAQRAAGVRVSPPELYLGEIAPDRDIEGAIVLLKSGAQAAPVDAREVAVDPAGLLDPRVETLTAGETQRIMLKLMHRPAGAFFGRVRFRPREGGPELSIGASGRVGARVEVEPPALVLREGRREASALLARAGGGEVHVLAAEDPSKRLLVETAAAEDGAARVIVRLGGDVPLDGLRGEVRVATGVPGAEEVRIPVVGFAGP